MYFQRYCIQKLLATRHKAYQFEVNYFNPFLNVIIHNLYRAKVSCRSKFKGIIKLIKSFVEYIYFFKQTA